MGKLFLFSFKLDFSLFFIIMQKLLRTISVTQTKVHNFHKGVGGGGGGVWRRAALKEYLSPWRNEDGELHADDKMLTAV